MNISSVISSRAQAAYAGMSPYRSAPGNEQDPLDQGVDPAAASQTGQDASRVEEPSLSGEPRDRQDPQTHSNAPGKAAELTAEELQLVEDLEKTDQEVRRHEMAHVAAGGALITSGAQFSYETGPDGKQYAVAGEVGIDTSPVPGDPQATIRKMQQIKRAALAPADPSSQDVRVASQATSTAAKASGELTALVAKQQAAEQETQAFGGHQKAADAYAKVSSLPEEDTHTFGLAV